MQMHATFSSMHLFLWTYQLYCQLLCLLNTHIEHEARNTPFLLFVSHIRFWVLFLFQDIFHILEEKSSI